MAIADRPQVSLLFYETEGWGPGYLSIRGRARVDESANDAVNEGTQQHDTAARWLTEQLNGSRRVGRPSQSLNAFLRILDPPALSRRRCRRRRPGERVTDWLAASAAWVPEPGPGYVRILGALVSSYDIRGNLVPDAALAALAIEHGASILSADTALARLREVAWENPVS